MHNAFAHFLNNMLFLAGTDLNKAALKKVRAELYRAHTYIQSPDTSCLEAETMDGTEIYFYVTHAPDRELHPKMEIIGTEGKVTWSFENEETEVELNNDETLQFDNEGVDPWLEVFRVASKVHRGELSRPYSTLDNSRPFVVTINSAYNSSNAISKIPDEFVEEYTTNSGRYKTELVGIDSIIEEAFRKRDLFSDIGVEWAESSVEIKVKDYNTFSLLN